MGRLKATWTPTQREAARILSAAGFSRRRGGKGSHAVWEHPEGPAVVLPTGHPTRKVSPVVYRSIGAAVAAVERR